MLLNDTTPSSTTPASVAASPEPAPAAPVDNAAPDKSTDTTTDDGASFHADLAKAYRRASGQRDRDGSGRFASRDPKPDGIEPPKEAAKEPASVDGEGQPPKADDKAPDQPAEAKPKTPAVEPPRAWNADAKAKWAAVPPELQQVISQRETELHEIKSQYGRVNAEAGAFKQAYEPFNQYLQAVGMNPPQFMKEALTTSYMLDTKPEMTIKHLAKTYGVDLLKLVDMSEPAPNPQVAALERENHMLKQRQAAEEQQRAAYQKAAREQQYLGIVESFLSTKPEAAKVQRELFEEIAAINAANPNKGAEEVLDLALERALWLNPETRAARIKQESETAERARVEAAKKAADAARQARGVNVNGAVISGAQSGDLETDLRSIWRKAANR